MDIGKTAAIHGSSRVRMLARVAELTTDRTVASFEIARRIIRNGEYLGSAQSRYGLNYIYNIDGSRYYIRYDKSGTPCSRKREPA